MWFIAAIFHQRRRLGDRNSDRRGPSQSQSQSPSISVRITNTANGEGETRCDGNSAETESMPLLYALAKSWAWEAVAFRCRAYPHEAAANWTDHRGDNILHWCAFGHPPLSPVQALLDACPDLARVTNNQGLLPLHGK
jgi:hypothetical protein